MKKYRRNSRDPDLPKNLYCYNGYYKFRNIKTGKCYGLGRDKDRAITIAEQVNRELEPPNAILDRILNGYEQATGKKVKRRIK